MKLCIFIFVSFKNAIDCIIIDTPLNDTSPEIIGKSLSENMLESSFAPLVISTSPNKIPFVSVLEKPSLFVRGQIKFVSKSNAPRVSNSSLKR